MPCTYDPDPDWDKKDLQKELDKVAQMLCSTMSIAFKNQEFWKTLPYDARTWWMEHQKKDQSRIENQIKSAQQYLKQLEKETEVSKRKQAEQSKKIEDLAHEREEILKRKLS